MRSTTKRPPTDAENRVVSNDPQFRALIERSRRRFPAGSGLTTAEVRRKLRVGRSDEDGGYIADIPDLVSCSAFGATPREALAELERAKTAWLETARAERKPIPVPRYGPAGRPG